MNLGLQALSGLAQTQPLVRAAVKYWWLALPAGYALWTLTKQRGKVSAGTMIQDFSMTFGPVISVIMLAELMETKKAQPAAPTPLSGTSAPRITDAQFQVRKEQPAIQSGRMMPGTFSATAPNFPPEQPFPEG